MLNIDYTSLKLPSTAQNPIFWVSEHFSGHLKRCDASSSNQKTTPSQSDSSERVSTPPTPDSTKGSPHSQVSNVSKVNFTPTKATSPGAPDSPPKSTKSQPSPLDSESYTESLHIAESGPDRSSTASTPESILVTEDQSHTSTKTTTEKDADSIDQKITPSQSYSPDSFYSSSVEYTKQTR